MSIDANRSGTPVVNLTSPDDPDSAPHQVGAEAVATWRSIYAALEPIIGHRGMCALYQRSLRLACPEFPWLGAVHATALDSGDFDALRIALLQQPGAIGIAANGLLLDTFCTLLSGLIGDSLTARLLINVATINLSGPAVAGNTHHG